MTYLIFSPDSPSPPPVSSWDDLQDLPATDTEDDGADNRLAFSVVLYLLRINILDVDLF